MDLILAKIRQDLKRLKIKDYNIEILSFDRNADTFITDDNIIDFQNAIVYAYSFETNPETRCIIKSYDKRFEFLTHSDSVIKFLTPIQIDTKLTKLKYILVRLIR